MAAIKFEGRSGVGYLPAGGGADEVERVGAAVREFIADVEGVATEDERHVAENFDFRLRHPLNEVRGFGLGDHFGERGGGEDARFGQAVARAWLVNGDELAFGQEQGADRFRVFRAHRLEQFIRDGDGFLSGVVRGSNLRRRRSVNGERQERRQQEFLHHQ